MAEVVGIVASVFTLVQASRKVTDGIGRLSDLKHAPQVLLALNNEVVDLQCVIEDVANLEQLNKETLQVAITPSFSRAIARTKEVLLNLEELIAYKLTQPDSKGQDPRVDRSTWIRSQNRIEQALQDIRDCRNRLSTAIAILTTYRNAWPLIGCCTQQLSIHLDTLLKDNPRCHEDLSSRLIGLGNPPPPVVPHSTSSANLLLPNHDGVSPTTELISHPASNHAQYNDGESGSLVPNVHIQVLRRRPCHSACRCTCHRAHRLLSPGILQKLVGNLFLGYSGLPSPFQRCDMLHCRGNSLAHAKMTYRFPSWFWQRAINITFCSGTSPELLLRFPCVRPYNGDWFDAARDVNVDRLKHLIQRKQASDAELDYDIKLLLSPQYRSIGENISVSEMLEEPILHMIYNGPSDLENLRERLIDTSITEFEETNAVGETLLMKAIRCNDEPTVRLLLENGASTTSTNRLGETCISLACRGSSTVIVRLLLDYGADPMISDFRGLGYDAVSIAVMCNGHDVLECLFDHSTLKWQYVTKRNVGDNLLHVAAEDANIQTLELLSSVRWITTDVEAYINSLDIDRWTPHKIIYWRRWNNEGWARKNGWKPDEDPEQVYRAFMKLVQKVVDDHYGIDVHEDHEGETSRRRMVAIPRNGSNRFLDIVEESSIEEVFDSDTEASETENSSDQEEWDDALEYRDEVTQNVTGNEEAE
ncbi:MAG: hypothetical protein Q9186_002789 [Xanthomendoza sp. 1 TL-2023]